MLVNIESYDSMKKFITQSFKQNFVGNIRENQELFLLTEQQPAKSKGFARTVVESIFQEIKGQFHFQEEHRIPFNSTKVERKKRKGKRRPEIEGI